MKPLRNLLGAAAVLLLANAPAWGAPEVNVSPGAVLVDGKVAPGIAVHGHDVVAYFREGKPTTGEARFATVYHGATYRFASQENLDEFLAHPAKYEPAYGGYCAYGVALGAKFDGDPRYWKIVDGKLYLNVSGDIQNEWGKDIAGNIKKAEANWPTVVRK